MMQPGSAGVHRPACCIFELTGQLGWPPYAGNPRASAPGPGDRVSGHAGPVCGSTEAGPQLPLGQLSQQQVNPTDAACE